MPTPAQPLPPLSRGQKRPSADLITFNSASQTFVNSQPLYQGRADCQRLSFFYCRCCELATQINLPVSKRLSKTILSFFSPPESRILKERKRENILSRNLSKSFLHFFFTFLWPSSVPPQPRGIPSPKSSLENHDGSEQFGQHLAVRSGGGIRLRGCHQHRFKSFYLYSLQSRVSLIVPQPIVTNHHGCTAQSRDQIRLR